MHAWTGGGTDEEMTAWTDGRMDGRMDVGTDGCINGRMDSRTEHQQNNGISRLSHSRDSIKETARVVLKGYRNSPIGVTPKKIHSRA